MTLKLARFEQHRKKNLARIFNPCKPHPMKRTKSRGNRAGKGKVWISTSIPEDVDAMLRRLATLSKVTRGAYARECLLDGVERELIIGTTRQPAKIMPYPLEHPENPTARAADDAGI